MVDSTLYLYTSLTAGSSHIITATSRLETILKANKIPFRAIDCATDEKARQLWSRRGKGKKIPGLVKYGQIIGVRVISTICACYSLTSVTGSRTSRRMERIRRAQGASQLCIRYFRRHTNDRYSYGTTCQYTSS